LRGWEDKRAGKDRRQKSENRSRRSGDREQRADIRRLEGERIRG